MIRILVLGHGGYAEGVKSNLAMLVGQPGNMYFLDLTPTDDLADLEKKVTDLLEGFGSDQVLFACDLMGASPFRVAAIQTYNHPGDYMTVAGLNTMAYLELGMESELTLSELADRAIDTTKNSVIKYPE